MKMSSLILVYTIRMSSGALAYLLIFCLPVEVVPILTLLLGPGF